MVQTRIWSLTDYTDAIVDTGIIDAFHYQIAPAPQSCTRQSGSNVPLTLFR